MIFKFQNDKIIKLVTIPGAHSSQINDLLFVMISDKYMINRHAIISCSRDKMIKAWAVADGASIITYSGHTVLRS